MGRKSLRRFYSTYKFLAIEIVIEPAFFQHSGTDLADFGGIDRAGMP
jgi:hypothetical protein